MTGEPVGWGGPTFRTEAAPAPCGWIAAARPPARGAAAMARAAALQGGRALGEGAAVFDGAAQAIAAARAVQAADATAELALSVGFGCARAPDLQAAPGELRVTAAAFAEARRWLPGLSARTATVLRHPGEAAGVEALVVLRDARGAAAAPALRHHAATPPENAALLVPLRAEGDADALRLALGVGEALAARLARWRGLSVIAPSAAALPAAEAGDPAAAARRIGARWAATGSLRRDGDAALCVMQVLDASDGRLVWSGWRRAAERDLFAIEAALAEALAAAVAATLGAAPPPEPPADARACALARRGAGWLSAADETGWRRAAAAFDAALALDPGFAAALAGRAQATLDGWRHGWDPLAAPDAAAEQARRAVAADPLDAAAWRVLAAARTAAGAAAEAAAAARKAVALNPADPDARAALAAALTLAGRGDAALAEIARATALHPSHPDAYLAVEAAAALTAGVPDAAATAALRMRAPEEARLTLAAALLALGDEAAALRAAALARAERPGLDAEGWLARLGLGTAEARAHALRALALR